MSEKIDKKAVLKLVNKHLGFKDVLLNKKINALPTEKSYTTRNEEVVKMVQDEIERLDSSRTPDEATYATSKRIAATDILIGLLIKLQPDTENDCHNKVVQVVNTEQSKHAETIKMLKQYHSIKPKEVEQAVNIINKAIEWKTKNEYEKY